jgi:sugar lactone lactonase YvrE
MTNARCRLVPAFIVLAAAACRDAAEARPIMDRAPSTQGVAVGWSSAGAKHVRTIAGFNDPESVRYDPEQDVYFVSNTAGFGSLKDDNGYITRIPAGALDSGQVFVAGGEGGVTLHAPKGMAIQGDTLWVTDIDVVRGFDRRTGAPLRVIDLSSLRPTQLNDIAAGPGGVLRVTDTGIHMVYEGNIPAGGDRVIELAGGSARVIVEGPDLKLPNGITWDSVGNRWMLLSFDRFAGRVWQVGDTAARVLREGKGQLDGIEVLPDGAVLFSSWADSSIHHWVPGRDTRFIRDVPEPADIGVDTRRGLVLIPLAVLGQVQVWDLGPWWRQR